MKRDMNVELALSFRVSRMSGSSMMSGGIPILTAGIPYPVAVRALTERACKLPHFKNAD